MTRWLLGLALLLAASRPARACDDTTVHERVLGVASDGRFVVRTLGSGGVDCTLEGFELRDGQGALLGRFVDEPDAEHDCSPNVHVEGKMPFEPNASDKADALAARLVQHLSLKSLLRTPLRLSVQQDFSGKGDCFRVFSIEKQGYVPLWHEPYTYGVDCAKVSVAAQRTPRNGLLFLNYSYARGGVCSVDVRGTYWITSRELEGLRTLHRGEQAFRAGNDARALELSDAALQLAPDLIGARKLQARSLARSGAAWASARKRLKSGYVTGGDCLGGTVHELWALDQEPLFAAWLDDPDYAAWSSHEAELHDQAHPQEQSAHWRRP